MTGRHPTRAPSSDRHRAALRCVALLSHLGHIAAVASVLLVWRLSDKDVRFPFCFFSVVLPQFLISVLNVRRNTLGNIVIFCVPRALLCSRAPSDRPKGLMALRPLLGLCRINVAVRGDLEKSRGPFPQSEAQQVSPAGVALLCVRQFSYCKLLKQLGLHSW